MKVGITGGFQLVRELEDPRRDIPSRRQALGARYMIEAFKWRGDRDTVDEM